MAAWEKGRRHTSHYSNSNIAALIFGVLFVTWIGLLVWANYGGPKPPPELPTMAMTALGVAITTKSRDEKSEQKVAKEAQQSTAADVENLKTVAKKTHPEIAERILDKESVPMEPDKDGVK